MRTQIVKMINDFEHGRLSRRQLIAYLTGMFAASLGATIGFADQQPGRAATTSADSAPTFDATEAARRSQDGLMNAGKFLFFGPWRSKANKRDDSLSCLR